MSKAYRSLSSSSGEKYQKSQSMGNAHTEDKAKGTMEKPSFGMNAKKVMREMKYAPKTVSYAEFTSAKNAAKMQSMVGSKVDNYSTSGKMESGYVSSLPKHKQEKSFDIDVTKYTPRKAKG